MKNIQNKTNHGKWPHKIVPQWTKDGLIMFTEGETVIGHVEGTHDSIRDGSSNSKTDWGTNCKYTCTEKDWIEAGNKLPKDKPVLEKQYSQILNASLQHMEDPQFKLLQTVDGSYKWNCGMFDRGNLSKDEGLIIINKIKQRAGI